MKLKQSDLAFQLAQVIFGTQAPFDPFDFSGIRDVSGTNNNALHITNFIDQYGHTVNTDTFAVANHAFIRMTDVVVRNGPAADNQTLPGFPPGMLFGDNYAPTLNVVDASPRIISRLVADMDPATNPNLPPPEDPIIGNPGDPAIFVTPFNSLFTMFGQFVDHGLDLINKGGAGLIAVPVLPGDPLFDPTPGAPNMMFVTRASRDASGNTINATAPLVDQQQTYGSDQATRAYLFEYDDLGNKTGRLVTNADGGMATWADIKANAVKGGLTPLDDFDVAQIPGAVPGQAFLNDIAHTANPFSSSGALLDSGWRQHPGQHARSRPI